MIALYTRVSTDIQLEGYSLRAQEELLIEYCRSNTITDYQIYRDEGCSAHQPYNKRPVMMQLLKDVEEGIINRILFIKLDRWMRDVKEYHKVQEILDRHKCTWRAITEDYETETANGRFTVNIMLSVAQNEAERTSERIKLTNRNKIMHGEPVTSQPMGYKIIDTPEGKRIDIDQKAVEPLKWLINDYITYRSTTGTLRKYNERYGTQRSYFWIRSILDKVEVYSGKHELNPNYRPRILDDHDIIRVKTLRSARKERHRKSQGVKLFSGLVVCPGCGTVMVPNSDKSRYTGKYTYYYFCQRKLYKRGCDYNLYVKEGIIEEYLLDHLQDVITSTIEIRVREIERPDEEKKQAEKLKERLRRLNKMYELGTIEDDEYENSVSEIRAKLKAIENKAKTVQLRPEDLEEIKDVDIRGLYGLMDLESRAAFWHRYIREIHLHPVERRVTSVVLA